MMIQCLLCITCFQNVSDPESADKEQEEESYETLALNCEEAESPVSADEVIKSTSKTDLGHEVRRKRKKTAGNHISAEVKSLTDVASSATKVLAQLATKTPVASAVGVDADWEFCKFLYAKLKTFPGGDVKEDLLLEIQQLFHQARKRGTNQGSGRSSALSSKVFSSSSGSQESQESHGYGGGSVTSFDDGLAVSCPTQSWSIMQEAYHQNATPTYQQMLQDASHDYTEQRNNGYTNL